MLGEEDPESCGVRRATVTDAGRTHYITLCQIHNPPATVAVSTLRVPDPQFPIKIPAGRRSSCSKPLPAPGGQPDPPHQSGRSSSGLRWARRLDDGRLHLLQPGTVSPAGNDPRCSEPRHAGPAHRPVADRPAASPCEVTPTMLTTPSDRGRDAHSTATLVRSVSDKLTELERAGHHPDTLAALRRVLACHQPTPAGRCRTCRWGTWRHLWRSRPFPCVIWHQIRSELLGVFASGAPSGRAQAGLDGVNRHRGQQPF